MRIIIGFFIAAICIGAGVGIGVLAGIAVTGYDTPFPALTAAAGGMFGYAAAVAITEHFDL